MNTIPMTRRALDHLADEERRLSNIPPQVGPDASGSDTPDSAAIAEWLRDTDALDRRLAAVREAVNAAEIVAGDTTAVIGREVRVADDGQEDTFRLVIPGAGDPASGAISISSPLGSALVGAGPGETVEFETPAGTRSVTIIAIGADATPF